MPAYCPVYKPNCSECGDFGLDSGYYDKGRAIQRRIRSHADYCAGHVVILLVGRVEL